MKTRALALAMVVGIAGWLAAVAAACHSEIAATIDCNGAVTWTATAWNDSSATDTSRSNSDVRVYASLDNGGTWSQIGSGRFEKSNGFTFSGTYQAGSASSVVVKVREYARWGNGDQPAEARTVTARRSSSCGDNGGGTQCSGMSKVTSSSVVSVGAGKGTVSFSVGRGCGVQLSLVSYTAPSPKWEADKASQQRYYASVTQTLAPGSYQWSVAVPSCYYQVDFVYGTPITSGAPLYGDRLIRSSNGGSGTCTTSTTPPGGGGSATPPAPVPAPAISLMKQERVGTTGSFVSGPVTAAVGDTVYYALVVTNLGTTTVSVNMKDDGCDAGTLAPAGPQAIVAGGTVTLTCSHRLTSADGAQYVNTALATATNAGTQQATVTASATTKVAATAGVKGRTKVVKPKPRTTTVKRIKKVKKAARPARPVIHTADFTG